MYITYPSPDQFDDLFSQSCRLEYLYFGSVRQDGHAQLRRVIHMQRDLYLVGRLFYNGLGLVQWLAENIGCLCRGE